MFGVVALVSFVALSVSALAGLARAITADAATAAPSPRSRAGAADLRAVEAALAATIGDDEQEEDHWRFIARVHVAA